MHKVTFSTEKCEKQPLLQKRVVWNIDNPALKKHVPFFPKNCNLHNIVCTPLSAGKGGLNLQTSIQKGEA